MFVCFTRLYFYSGPRRPRPSQRAHSCGCASSPAPEWSRSWPSRRPRARGATTPQSPVRQPQPVVFAGGVDVAEPDLLGRQLQLRSAVRSLALLDQSPLVQPQKTAANHHRTLGKFFRNHSRGLHCVRFRGQHHQNSQTQPETTALCHEQQATTHRPDPTTGEIDAARNRTAPIAIELLSASAPARARSLRTAAPTC